MQKGAVALSKTYTGYSIKERFKLAICCIIFLNATAALFMVLFGQIFYNLYREAGKLCDFFIDLPSGLR